MPSVKTVMIVEDDDALRSSLTDVFEDAGYGVIIARDGRDALSQLHAGARPCAIFLDLMMPNMNGWEFREAQLQDPRLSSICTTVMTASNNLGTHPIKADHVITKPLGLAQLLRVAAQCCAD